MYSVVLEADADEFYATAERALVRKLVRCFTMLEQNPYKHPNIKRLKDELAGRYRYRIGDYRVIYKIDERESQVIVLKIGHRSEVYE